MLTESFLLGTVGAAAGLLIARPLLRLFVDFFSGTSVLAIDARIDGRTLAFAAATSISTVLLFGAMPAWGAARRSVGSVLKETAANLSGRTSRFLTGRYLVSIQIALSLPLLVGAGLFLRTIESLASVDLGFHTENVLTFQTDPGRSGYKPSQESEIYRRIESNLALLPGVETVAMSHLPLIGGMGTVYPIRLPGDDQNKRASLLFCSDSFLSTMRIPIVLGRDLTKEDFDQPARNVVVNEAFVKMYLASVDPVGQIFYPPPAPQNSQSSAPYTIVGVAKDAHYRAVREMVPPVVYIPYAWRSASDMRMVFMLRTRVAPLSLVSAVRSAVANVDKNLPVAEIRSEQEQVDRSLGTERLFATLVTTFGVIAILLAAIGLYGVMAIAVNRRTPEIGIRMALGAQPGSVQWLILRQSLSVTLFGIVAGVAFVFLLSSLIAKLLFGVKPYDPISIAGAVMVMIAVAACAAWLPAARASRVDAMVALRHQ
jgi:predicted permease